MTLSTIAPINYMMPPEATENDYWDFASEYRFSCFGSLHPGGANFALVDGSTRFIAQTVDLKHLQSLSTRARGEVLQLPQ